MIEKLCDGYIRVHSVMVGFIDVIFQITEIDKFDLAMELLVEAYNEYWKSTVECYGDLLEEALIENDIDYVAWYISGNCYE